MTATTSQPNRGATVLGTNAGSFKAKTNSAPGGAAALAGSGMGAGAATGSAPESASSSMLVGDYSDSAAEWASTVAHARRFASAPNRDFDEIRETQDRLRSLAIRHAQTERGAEEVRTDADVFEYDPASAERYISYAAQRRAEVTALADLGYGHNAVGVSIAQVRRDLSPGTEIEVQFLRAHLGGGLPAPERRVVSSQTSHQMVSTRASDGIEIHNQWSRETAHKDEAGNYIVSDEHGDPFVAYRVVS